MKTKSVLASITAALLMGTTSALHAGTGTFTFSDSTFELGDDAGFFVGDILSGEVVVDTATGDYSVYWEASPLMPFLGPLQFILQIGNARTGEVVSLSKDVGDSGVWYSYSYSGNEPVLTGWLDGDTLSTAGSAPSFNEEFTSAVSSLDTTFPFTEFHVDTVAFSGPYVADNPDPDSDGDGIPDSSDPFPESQMGETVVLLGVDTGIPNEIEGLPVSETGASLADVILALEAGAAEDARNHGQYVSAFSKSLLLLVNDAWINSRQRAELIRIVAGSSR